MTTSTSMAMVNAKITNSSKIVPNKFSTEIALRPTPRAAPNTVQFAEAKGKKKGGHRARSKSSTRSRRSERGPSVPRRVASAPKKAGKSRRSETGIVSMDAAPSDFLGRSQTIAGGSDIVERYVEQLVNPWCPCTQRLPDDNIRPTSIAKFYANRTYTQNSTSTNGPNLLLGMHSRMSVYSATAPSAQTNVTVVTPGASANVTTHNVFGYAPGSIMLAQQFGANLDTGIQAGGQAANLGPWGDDYGIEASTTNSWTAAYRTLAMAIRLRIVGLPSGVFMAPGKCYVAQVRWNRDEIPLNEQDFVTLERLGYASHVSVDAIREAGSKTWYAVPDGADKFELSSEFYPAPGMFFSSALATYPSTGQEVRSFPGYTGLVAPSLSTLIVPHLTQSSTTGGITDAEDQTVADQTMVIIVGFFGLQDGIVIEADYSTTQEYIATPAAPPGIDMGVQLRNSAAMDQIFGAASILASYRAMMFQAPGDKTILSAPTSPFGHASESRANAEGRATRSRLVSAVRRSAGGLVRHGKTEGFWDFDWLKKGNLGGLSWDFSDKKGGGGNGLSMGRGRK